MTLNIDMKPDKLWFKLCLLILIIENHEKIHLCGSFKGDAMKNEPYDIQID